MKVVVEHCGSEAGERLISQLTLPAVPQASEAGASESTTLCPHLPAERTPAVDSHGEAVGSCMMDGKFSPFDLKYMYLAVKASDTGAAETTIHFSSHDRLSRRKAITQEVCLNALVFVFAA